MEKIKNKYRKLKKVAALLLASSLLTQMPAGLPVSVYGAVGTQPSKKAKVLSNSSTARLGATGQIEVGVRSSSLFPYQGEITVELALLNGKKETKQLQLSKPESEVAFARFSGVQGDGTVTVRAKGFAKYEQKVSVEPGWTTKILVSSVKFQTLYDAEPGWVRPGDVNDDGVIDAEDKKQMLDAIHHGSSEAVYDVNNDGSVDIADLQALVQSLDEKQESALEKHWTPNQVKIESGKVSGGKIENLLEGEQGVALKTANDAAISESNPVSLTFDLAQDGVSIDQIPFIEGFAVLAPLYNEETGSISSEIAGGEAEVYYVDENGTEQKKIFPLSEAVQVLALRQPSGSKVHVEADGSLVLDFGGQIAVKRVTIKITGTTKKEQPLVNIAKVEFVNEMENRIAPPQLDIPELTSLTVGEKSLAAAWTAQKNITGYEVSVTGVVKGQSTPQQQTVRVSKNTHTITSIHNHSLKNYETYTVKVRSVNGDWSSQWSKEKSAQIIPQKKPSPPDYVSTEAGYSSITVTWKDMEDSAGYMVYYKSENDADYQPVVSGFTQTPEGTGRLEENRYTITGLESETNYKVYVISWNHLGWSGPSLTAAVKTQSTAAPELPNYNLLNTPNGKGVLTSHITNAVMGGDSAKMISSPLDTTAKSALGLVDNDYASYWSKSDWDDGVAYPGADKGMTITLDADYKMNYFTFTAADIKVGVQLVRIQYWNSQGGTQAKTVGARLIEKKDAKDHTYYIVKLDETVTANQIRMCLGRSSGNRTPMMVGEIHFHQYDSIEDDIMGLYTDTMHTMLREDVTDSIINELRSRLETVDQKSGEKHPLYKELSLELKTAEEILHGNLDPSIEISNRITAKKDGHLGFSGLNAWQPLGKVAYAGETLLVYVGHNTKRTGNNADLQLVYTQHFAESSKVARAVSLKIGRNEITVPKLADTDCERGGQLYVAYTGNQVQDQYAVRIAGGSKIPVLNIYGKTGEARMEAIRTYVQELENYVSTIPASHDKLHTKDNSIHVDYAYKQEQCILNATDILMEKMMYSLPATQVYAGLGSASDKAVKLSNALDAMEQTMKLFYQHKGLSDDAGTARGNNALPSQHLNIRYMRMFAGAFMYAAGNHIGIGWGSSQVASAPNSWDGFGWGIAHEIGHNINQGTYAIAEITNNYFAQLLTKAVKGTRFNYENVYSKVTSNMPGQSSNIATQLALYWQLHLAFDNQKDDRYLYDNYEAQFQNLFFARVDTYSRNPAAAPQSGLVLDGGADQNLMRLSCAAANKNILPFFERWGMQPDKATEEYANKYGAKDQKALYYVNDEARDYRVDHLDANEAGTILNQDVIQKAEMTTVGKEGEDQKVQIQITSNLSDQSVLLGYEIQRTMVSNGKATKQVVGFVQAQPAGSTVFTDSITTVNNRVLSYEIKAVDKYLNYANAYYAGSKKISTDGALCKDNWTVETTMSSSDDTIILDETGNGVDDTADADPDSGYDPQNPENVEAKKVHSIDRVIDGKTDTVYIGTGGDTAEVIIDMHKDEQITSLKYWGSAVQIAQIQVSQDGKQWTLVKENYAVNQTGEEPEVIWFDSVEKDARDAWIGTYDARYVKLVFAKPGSMSIKELTLCGPTGDNLEFMKTEDAQPAVGVLTDDIEYGAKTDDVIPKGSLIFTGTYRGNPAYNVVLLYDKDGNVIGSKDNEVLAKQVIFADVPANGQLGETKAGVWVYYLEPDQWKQTENGEDKENPFKNSEVRAELYRVDNALTLEGERVVSDTEFIAIPEQLPDITAVGNKVPPSQIP